MCALIEATPHDLYLEPFVGMGGVFLRRRVRPRAEIINDWSQDVVNLFRCMRAHPAALTELTALMLASRADFDLQKRVDPSTLTDLQRAARFILVQKMAFGGRVASRSFGVRTDSRAQFRPGQVGEDLLAVAKRLEGVTIEHLPWADFIKRYDRAGALIYLDPPYFGCEGDYGFDLFGRDQFDEMAEVLANLKGRFVLSLNDRAEVRRIFRSFDVASVETKYSVGKGAQPAHEVIITPR